MEDPKRDEVNSQGDSSDQPGSSRGPPAFDKTIVKEALAELLSEIPGLKNLVDNSPSSSEGTVQLVAASKDADKQSSEKSSAKSKLALVAVLNN